MKKLLLALSICLSSGLTQAQLDVSTDSVHFQGPIGAIDSFTITINPGQWTDINTEITATIAGTTYGQPAFSVSESSFFLDGTTPKELTIYFDPRHNITHDSELLLQQEFSGAVSIDLVGEATHTNSYYSSTNNLSEEALKAELKSVITSGQNSLGYNSARDEMYMVIDNKFVNGQGASQNELETAYTGTTISGYANRTAAQNMGVNTEHTWPQSLFNSSEPMRSDIHHLFITKSNPNSQRGNLPFGTVSNADWEEAGSKRGGGKFEVRNVQKGSTARAMMYFVTRYQNYNDFMDGQEAILRQWAADYPPDAVDEARNDAIQQAQGNRNPYVDYPLFLERINSLSNTSSAPADPSILISEDEIDFETVIGGGLQSWPVILVNDGNVDITISNIEIADDNQFNIDVPSDPFVIKPGESSTINILMDIPGTDKDTELQFETDVPGSESVEIPLMGSFIALIVDPDLSPPDLKVFPNPASEEVRIQRNDSEPFTVEIFDIKGQRVWVSPTASTAHTVSTANLSAGVYSVRDSRQEVIRLIVK